MRKYMAVMAALVVAILGGSTAASATTIEVDPAGNITGTDATVTFTSGSGNVICAVTLRGTLAASINAVEQTQGGSVTAGTVNEGGCEDTIFLHTGQGSLAEGNFPWSVVFKQLDAAEVMRLLVKNPRFSIIVSGFIINNTCVYEAESIDVVTDTMPNVDVLTTIEPREAALIDEDGDGGCPAEGVIDANFTLSGTQDVVLVA